MMREEMSSEELIAELREMVRVENRIDRDALLHLFELERRGDIARAGHQKVAEFCVEELGMKEKAARCRARAIGMMKRWPRCAEMIRDGSLTMSTMVALGDVMTYENCGRILDDVAGMSEQDVELYLMMNFDAETRRINLRVDQDWQADLEELTELAGHAAGVGIAKVLQYGMRIAIAELRKRKRMAVPAARRPATGQETAVRRSPGHDAQTVPSRAPSPVCRPPGGHRAAVRRQYIPITIRREVWHRDGACCTYVSPSGRRCGSRLLLEFHHIVADAFGGPPTAADLTVRCHTHNHLAAIDDFGLEHMERKRRRRAARSVTGLRRREEELRR